MADSAKADLPVGQIPESQAADPAVTWRLRIVAYLGLLLVVVAMLGPPVRRPPRDSFPLSTYPMFSTARQATSVVAVVVGETAEGDRVRLNPGLVGGTSEVMLAVQTASRAVSAGDGAVATLCEQVAGRVRDAGRTDIVAVEVATETYHAIDHLTSDAPPISVAVHTTCEVG